MDNLNTKKINEKCKVIEICIQNAEVKRRFLEFGIFPGTSIVVLKKSMLGKVLLIEVNGLKLAIRSTFAEQIVVA